MTKLFLIVASRELAHIYFFNKARPFMWSTSDSFKILKAIGSGNVCKCVFLKMYSISSRTGLPLRSRSNVAQVIMTNPLRSELLNRKIDVAFTLDCILSYNKICRFLKADHTLPYSRKTIALLFFSSVSVP